MLRLSLQRRLTAFRSEFPDQSITMYRLRQTYARHKVKQRVLQWNMLLTAAQQYRYQKQRRQILPRVIKLISKKAQFLFCDETVFSTNQTKLRVWHLKGQQATVHKKRLSFKAVAVVAAIDLKGAIVGLTMRPKSISTTEFIDFLHRLALQLHPGAAYLFLDNLPVHHTLAVREKATELGITLLFNAPYSCEYNAIEGLWAHAKQRFSRQLLDEVDLGNSRKIHSLVEECIMATPAIYLRRRIARSLKKMQKFL